MGESTFPAHSMMKVLLIYPDFSPQAYVDEKFGFYSEGLASISSVLKRAGHEVRLYHIMRQVALDEFLETIKYYSPDLIGFHLRTSNFLEISRYIPYIKKDGIQAPIICGGYHPSLAPDEVLNMPGVDMICIGESEFPLLELCDAMEHGKEFRNIKNIWVKTDNDIIRNPIRPLIENLDELPLPDFDLFDFDNLTSSKIYTAGVMLSRGCPFNCAYCCNHAIRNLYPNKAKYARKRSPQNAIRYLKKLLSSYKYIKYITFWDNNLSYPHEWFYEFIFLYKSEIHLPFSCNLHPNTVDETVVNSLKEAGCYRVHIGVEHGNEPFRRNILNRNISNNQIIKVFSLCRAAGISTLSYNMVNSPLETPSIFLDTVRLNALIKPTRALAAIFYPYPGTDAYNMSLKHGLITLLVNYSAEIILQNTKFPKPQVKFFSLYFRVLIKVYQFIFKLPKKVRFACEKLFDSILISKYLPYDTLNKLMELRRKLVNRLKTVLRTALPQLYVFMRDLSLRKG